LIADESPGPPGSVTNHDLDIRESDLEPVDRKITSPRPWHAFWRRLLQGQSK
jgi:hypothetical protein